MAMVATNDWGTKKRIPVTTIAGTYTAATTHNIDVSSYVPKGTKAIWLYIEITDNAAGTTAYVQETGSGVEVWGVHSIVANQVVDGNGDIQLDSSYTFDLVVSAAMTAVTLKILGVYL